MAKRLHGTLDKTVKGLFAQFEETDNSAKKQKLVAEAVAELKVHAAVEEQVFYPALRQHMEDEDGLLDEADEEHHVAKFLIAELEAMKGDEEHWEAKFTVLAENVKHHIKEEEGELFPKAKETDIDFVELGRQIAEAKASLKREGVPPTAEAKMVGKSGLRGDSPAKQALANFEAPLKTTEAA
jgi:hemerythrin-like domain-containing protein